MVGGLFIVTTAALGTGSHVSAADGDAEQASIVDAAVAEATGPIAVADIVAGGDGEAIVAAEGGTTVELPTDPADGIEATSQSGVTVGIGLPGATTADDARVTSEGTVVYTDALPSVSIAAQALADGGVRALVTIEGSNAPTQYRFPIDTPAGGRMELQADGSVNVIDGAGMPAGHFDAPWATDSTGGPVPTSYRVDGATLVQTVGHSSNYPVVADPHYTWGWVTGTVYFNKAETIKIAASTAFIAAIGSLAPPPFNIILVASAGTISLVASWAAADGHCVKVKSTGSIGIYWGNDGDKYCR